MSSEVRSLIALHFVSKVDVNRFELARPTIKQALLSLNLCYPWVCERIIWIGYYKNIDIYRSKQSIYIDW